MVLLDWLSNGAHGRRRRRRSQPRTETRISASVLSSRVCQYCNYSFTDGWGRLLEYDDVYQNAIAETTTQSTHGFHESWDELSDELGS